MAGRKSRPSKNTSEKRGRARRGLGADCDHGSPGLTPGDDGLFCDRNLAFGNLNGD
jgi:hypothetical protein